MGVWDEAQYVCCLQCITRGGSETLIDERGIPIIFRRLDLTHIHPDESHIPQDGSPSIDIHDPRVYAQIIEALARIGALVVATSAGTASDILSSTSTGDKTIFSGSDIFPLNTVFRPPGNLASLTGYPGLPYAGKVLIGMPGLARGIILDVFPVNGAPQIGGGTVNLTDSKIILHLVSHTINIDHTHTLQSSEEPCDICDPMCGDYDPQMCRLITP